MTLTLIYPRNAELHEIAQEKQPVLTKDDPIFQMFPLEPHNTDTILWEQLDNYMGLQQLRGLDGKPVRVKATSGKRFAYTPGVYGEFELIDETFITRARPWGQMDGAIDLRKEVVRRQDKLLSREIDRIRGILWTLLVTGVINVALPTGGTDAIAAYTTQTAAGSAWGTPGTGTPLGDFRATMLLGRGHGVNFGAKARAYMNRATLNKIMSNTNANDIGGKRIAGLSAPIGLAAINNVLLEEDLPQIVPYDEGYFDETGTFQLFIPNNKTVIIGARNDGSPVGEYALTRNANNPNMEPGAYDKIVDDQDEVPRQIEIHRGHNGGPILYFPSAIVVLTTT